MRDGFVPGICLICGQRASRFWGIGGTYETSPGELLSDISVAGFCLAHRQGVLEEVRLQLDKKGIVHYFMEPAIELRTNEIEPFFAFMQAGLG